MLPQAAPAGEVFFSKRCYVKDNTSWLCMLETSVLRKLLEDNEAEQLHWFRKNGLKYKNC